MPPLVDTATSYRLLINTFDHLKVPYLLTTEKRDLVVLVQGVVGFHFNTAGTYLKYVTDNKE